MMALRNLNQFFEFVIACLQLDLFVMGRRFGLFFLVFFMLSIIVTQVYVIGILTYKLDGLSRIIIALCGQALDQTYQVLHSQLIFFSYCIGMLIAVLEQGPSACVGCECAIKCGCKAM